MITKAQRIARVQKLERLLKGSERLSVRQLSERTGLSGMSIPKIAARLGLADRVIKRSGRDFSPGDFCL